MRRSDDLLGRDGRSNAGLVAERGDPMSAAVRYKTKADRADENERLVDASVF
jgi:hypothetical protein